MKTVAFIFSFYILFLSAVPCCALDNCKDEAGQSQTSGSNDERNDGCKNCSPFSLCGDCAGFSIITNHYQVDIPKLVARQVYPAYIQAYFPVYVSSFWQPPRSGR